jgi:signal transduction histidine kinase
VLGAVPMLALVRRDAVPFRGQSAAILVGTVTPGIANLLFLAGLVPVPAFDPTPIAFSISGIAFLGAISRFRLFGTSPSPNRRARRLIFERMQEGAVVVDSHDYVVDMNGRAADILDVSRREVLGSPAADLLPEYDRYPADGQMADPVTVHAESCPRSLDVAVTAITDIHGQSIGRLVSLHDIGEYLRQQQRLEVLHRVLRHNIRTETNLIYGYADRPTGDGQSEAARVKEHAMRIEEIGRKSRTIIELFDREHDEPEPVALDALLERTVRSVREEYPGVTITRDTVADSVQVAGVLEAVFENVVENAAEHNTASDPRVWVDAEVDGERVQVTVGDNGPGIDDHERAVLKRGTETPLEHGSGLGLWLVKWGTDIVGGQVTFAQNDPTGTVITLELPVLSRPVGVEGESDSGATAD